MSTGGFKQPDVSPCTENAGYSDILLTVTLFCLTNTVTVSGEACICSPKFRIHAYFSLTAEASACSSAATAACAASAETGNIRRPFNSRQKELSAHFCDVILVMTI